MVNCTQSDCMKPPNDELIFGGGSLNEMNKQVNIVAHVPFTVGTFILKLILFSNRISNFE